MARMVRAEAARRRAARPRPLRRGDARAASGEHDHLQRRRQFLRLVAPLLALRLHADAARADQRERWATASRAAVAAAIRFRDRPVVCVAGDGDFLMNGQELATAAQYGADLLVIVVDNGAYGTIRMHQEREYPKRIYRRPSSAIPTSPRSPARSAAGRRRSRKPRSSRPRSTARWSRRAFACIHCKTDVEQITNATTISKLREKAKG